MAELEGAFRAILTEYADDVARMTEEEVKEIGKECAADIRKHSPNVTGKYAKGWTTTKQTVRGQTVVIVHNKKAPGLAHLLEKGHAKVGGGRVEGYPHIAPAVDRAEKNLIKAIEKGIQNG